MIALRARPTVVFAATFMAAAPAMVALVAAPQHARAQFGAAYDPPRPPADVPGRPPAQIPAPLPAPVAVPPGPSNPQLLPPGPPPGRAGIQSEDLPPPLFGAPPGAPPPTSLQPAAVPPGVGPGAAPAAPGAGQRPQRAAIPPGVSPPAAGSPAAAPPPDDAVTPPPPGRITNPTAVFSGLDKITGRITSFDAAIGETVQFGALQVTARACYSRPPTETPLTDGFIEVDEVTLQGEVRRIFTGWMFAASPGLHGVEHAIYDVWLIDCKGGTQAVADAQPAPPPAPPPARPGAPAPPRQATPQRPPGAAPPQARQALPSSQGTLTQPGPPR